MFRNTILRQWGSAIGVSNVSDVSQYIKVIPNTQYTLSLETADSNYRRICFYKQPLLREEEQEDNTRFINYTEYLGNTKTFATPNECNYIRVAYLNSASKVQLEKSSTATTYTPHAEQNFILPCQQPMRAIGTARDVFFKNVVGSEYYNAELIENAWYERHAIYRKIFDGTEDWNNTYGTNLFDVQNINQSIFTANTLPSLSNKLSNYFKYNPVQSGINTSTIHGEFAIQIPVDYNIDWYKVFFKNTDFSTARDFARWLATQYANNTPVYADYELLIPTYLQCTSTQVEVLEAISKADSYSEQTNVSSPDAVSPVYTVTAFRDMNATVENLQARIDLLNN